ncbi:MAG: YciI family protein [Pseudomonadales bacterium]|nr:YciI family protein [Pseudomonadales bacterium]
MKYICLIYEDETLVPSRPEEEMNEIMGAYFAFTNEVQAAGKHLGGEALMPTETATTVTIRDGNRVTTDGPFVETKEQLGGFYLLDCENLDEAIELASKIPSAKWGAIEVRPIMVFD